MGLHAEIEDDVAYHTVHTGFGAENVLHRSPFLFQLVLLPVVEGLGLGLKPGVDLGLGPQALVDIPSLVNQVKYDPVFNALAELVGVDIATEDLQAGLPILFKQDKGSDKGSSLLLTLYGNFGIGIL